MKEYPLAAIELVLIDLGWTEHDSVNPHLKLWVPGADSGLGGQRLSGDDLAIFLPQDVEAPDYSRLINRSILQLADSSSGNIYEDLEIAELRVSRKLDKLQVRLAGESAIHGVVKWNEGVDLVVGTRELLVAGAKTVREYRRYFKNSFSAIANSYLENCYMNQTEVGSYIVSALVPSDANVYVSSSAVQKVQSSISSRLVTESVFGAVEASKEALCEFENKGNPEVFEWAMTNGVSVEVLRGISKILGSSETEVALNYLVSSSRLNEPREVSKSIELTPNLKSSVHKGIEVLSKAPSPRWLVISGEVTELKRRFDEPGSARIKIRASVGGRVRSFSVPLTDEFYLKAVEAHSSGSYLSVKGLADRGKFVKVDSVTVSGPILERFNEVRNASNQYVIDFEQV